MLLAQASVLGLDNPKISDAVWVLEFCSLCLNKNLHEDELVAILLFDRIIDLTPL